MRRLIETAKRKAIDIERLLDDRMNTLVRASDRPVEPLEVRNAILDDIERHVIPGPRGTRLFPFDEVRIELLARVPEETVALEAMLDFDGGLETVARQRLVDRQCRLTPDFSLRVTMIARKPWDWPSDNPYRLSFCRPPRPEASDQPERATVLELTLSPGGVKAAYNLSQERIDVGRIPEVRDRGGRLVRQNAVVIAEDHDPNGTVSRRHAHIKAALDPRGRRVYMLYDDASTYGTCIVRGGRTIAVHPGSLGVRLRDGDEVHFGEAIAVVRFGLGREVGYQVSSSL
jgi:hypothetical protein